MFDSLSSRLEGIVKRLRGKGRLTQDDVDEVLKEIRTALLDADVNVGVVRSVVARIRDQAVGVELSTALDPAQQVVKIVNHELTEMLGGQTLKITYAGRPPTVVLMAGLQGSGKTTSSAKLARWFKRQGRQPLLVGADLQRPAAVEQLRTLGRQIDVPVFSEPGDPVATAKRGLDEARRLGRDVLIVDTAGRLHNKAHLMAELEKMKRISGREVTGAPHETLLVIDAVTGQNGLEQARQFTKVADVTGIVLTKLDGTAKGGIAVAIAKDLNLPIRYVGIGEQVNDLMVFDPESYVNGLFN